MGFTETTRRRRWYLKNSRDLLKFIFSTLARYIIRCVKSCIDSSFHYPARIPENVFFKNWKKIRQKNKQLQKYRLACHFDHLFCSIFGRWPNRGLPGIFHQKNHRCGNFSYHGQRCDRPGTYELKIIKNSYSMLISNTFCNLF